MLVIPLVLTLAFSTAASIQMGTTFALDWERHDIKIHVNVWPSPEDVGARLNESVLTAAPPIRINSQSEFNVRFPSHVISSLDINGSALGGCIFIGNCTENFTIRDCYLHHSTGKKHTPWFDDHGIYIVNCSNILIENCNVSRNDRHGIVIESSRNIVVKKIDFIRNIYSGIRTGLCQNVSISDSWYVFNSQWATELASTTHARVYNNAGTLHGKSMEAETGCKYVDMYNNHWWQCQNGAVVSGFATNVNITNNYFQAFYAGIYLDSVSNVIIRGNLVDNTPGNGTRTYQATNNIISGNEFRNCSSYGIKLENSNSNSIMYNNLSGAKAGIPGISVSSMLSLPCRYNRIHHNNFIGTYADYLVYNVNTANFWNDTSGQGNWWWNWTTPDNDSNGIVDIPYLIPGSDGKDCDFYPLATRVNSNEAVTEPTGFLLVATVITIISLHTLICGFKHIVARVKPTSNKRRVERKYR